MISIGEKRPLVSIILPVYNRAVAIRCCLESILVQRFKNFELIIVDDGSIDDTPFICREIADNDSRVRFFCQSNKGVSAARNKGLNEAKGEWVTFVDSDDVILPTHLDIVENEENNEVDLLMTDFTFGKISNGNITPRRKIEVPVCVLRSEAAARYLFKDLNPFRNPAFLVWNKFFRNKLLSQYHVRFDESMSLGEDQVFVCAYLPYAHKLIHYATPTYVCLDWKGIHHLGTYLRTPADYLYNQKKNYNALYNIIPIDKESIACYSASYGIDRPITRILYNYTKNKNSKCLKRSELVAFTHQEIIPFLASIDISSGYVLKCNVRWVYYLLLHFGAFPAIAWCMFYNVWVDMFGVLLSPLRKLKRMF